MSHSKERNEKVCLNCNANLYDRYCHVCGQENQEPKETVWHLVSHFFNDITHFDGKFFSTVKYLLSKPGFLSYEYMVGKRMSYLNPIRLYVFTSAIFFLFLFSSKKTESILKIQNTETETKTGLKDWKKKLTKLNDDLKEEKDSGQAQDLRDEIESLSNRIQLVTTQYGDTSSRTFSEKDIAMMAFTETMDSLKKEGLPIDSLAAKKNTKLRETNMESILPFGIHYKSLGEYDSAQNKLPESRRDGWFKRMIYRKSISLNVQYRTNKEAYFEQLKENFIHSFPKIFFFSLPFFALLLKLVYIRRKNYYYVNHGIFTLHVYCATFILMFFIIEFSRLASAVPWNWLSVVLNLLGFALWLFIFVYFYKAMRLFYKQGRFKTILKYIIIGILALVINILLMVVFLAISAISVV